MKYYRALPIWTTKKRLEVLETFYSDVQDYYENSRAVWRVNGRIEEAAAKSARQRINFSLHKAHDAIKASGVSTIITYTPAPIVGGPIQNLDLVLNLFNIGDYQIAPDSVIGVIEQSLGVYRDDISAARRRTLNPFWWFGKFLSWFAAIPFTVIRKAGFDANRAEQSIIGKLLFLVFYMIPIIASLLTIFDLLDLLEKIKELLGL